MNGIAYVWDGNENPESFPISSPENELDGDAFWIWILDGKAKLNFEQWDGQAAECVGNLLLTQPELSEFTVAEDSPDYSGMSLREVAEIVPLEMKSSAEVEFWYHGTTADRIALIMEEGIRGDLPSDLRTWKTGDVPMGTVYLSDSWGTAAEYADRAARIYGSDPAVLEISAAFLDGSLICDDRDFMLSDCSRPWIEGKHGDCSAADASLTLTQKVGYKATVPSDAFTALLRRENGRWTKEEVSVLPAPC